MITLRPSAERGHANHGWLDTYHTFSFARYYDEAHMGFRVLRVINEDRVAPGRGFGTHPHSDMEIITYLLDGELAHKDSLGSGETIRRGDVQRISAGRGILHSEFNASETDQVHLLQIWLLPSERGLTPGYEQKFFGDDTKRGRLQLLVSPDGREDSLSMNQDAFLYATILEGDEQVEHTLAPDRHAWVQVARGTAIVNGEELSAGDGAALSDVKTVTIAAHGSTELLLFDLP
ncbi:hypothetical protein GF420_07300 [candidate division GN15 bacterium]|nr:hypothetical protein [candidate division GN15 bacterium]